MHMHTLMHTMKTPRTHHVLHTPASVIMTTTVRLTPSCETNELPKVYFRSRPGFTGAPVDASPDGAAAAAGKSFSKPLLWMQLAHIPPRAGSP